MKMYSLFPYFFLPTEKNFSLIKEVLAYMQYI